jgi:Spy/CpxP family protein refolding chaperone
MRQPTIAGTLVACGLLIGLALPITGLAQPPGGPEGRAHRWGHRGDRGPERFIEQHAEELGLSAESLEAIEKIVDDSRARSEALHEELRGEHEALRALLEQEMPDESAVMAQAEAINARKLQAHENRLGAMIAIRHQLTPEQRQELVRIREERVQRGKKLWALRACRDDVGDLCPEAGRGRAALTCLSDNWDELSEECRAVFEDGPRRRAFGRSDRSGPPCD